MFSWPAIRPAVATLPAPELALAHHSTATIAPERLTLRAKCLLLRLNNNPGTGQRLIALDVLHIDRRARLRVNVRLRPRDISRTHVVLTLRVLQTIFLRLAHVGRVSSAIDRSPQHVIANIRTAVLEIEKLRHHPPPFMRAMAASIESIVSISACDQPWSEVKAPSDADARTSSACNSSRSRSALTK